MNKGFPLHLKVTFLPSGISPSFISILANASTSAEALMLPTNKLTTPLAPTIDPMAPAVYRD